MSQDFYDLIEKYFNGLLSESENIKFNELLENNAIFKKEFDEYGLTMQVIRAQGQKHLKQKLTALNNKKVFQKKQIFYLSILIGVVGVLATLLYFIFAKNVNVPPKREVAESGKKYIKDQKPDSIFIKNIQVEKKESHSNPKNEIGEHLNHDSLFAANYKPFRDGSLEPTYRGEPNMTNRDKFLNLYWQEKYTEALLQYTTMTEVEKSNPNIKLQYAICLIQGGKYSSAETILEELKKEDKSRFGKEIEWYLSLLKIKRGLKVNLDTYEKK
ncbi:MAG: tetratricopeptide repeat protein [Saprospiraceae bacterium]|nr:tetratricopeptide repeat protein [Saprospiraceae bacterium]